MPLTRRHFAALAAGLLAAPRGAGAQTARGPAVVELFTSQGCSSCPPADALMGQLAQDAGVIPLTWPVEIWDYLGWRDTLAKPAFTARQRAYAAAIARKRIYTPQAIVNGRADCVGSDRSSIARLGNATASASGQRLALADRADGWVAMPPPGGAGARAILVPLATSVTVPIGRGENAGRTITYANVARDLRDLGPVSESRPITLARADVAAEGANGFALLIQAGSLAQPGEIIAGGYCDPAGIKA
ncbi:MAG: DUF1223 domain-containing protein [Hyphomicrobiales bacterium]|uniref:DUF1223 domain-containing protein n=1 Tax=Rhabdaerophilum calidifontis TaxID=2604328 RepID=UPI001409DEE2|nr:DUF1223 domain-containing protein [Rhabdaerophilum calidifontis]MCA1951877.1 DUF1223 domain-containing protein [Hyphomicrobiales bacterium]MCA1998673.1 DUF1223 domain-containing protein [Hyphomicrobiales bacterium]